MKSNLHFSWGERYDDEEKDVAEIEAEEKEIHMYRIYNDVDDDDAYKQPNQDWRVYCIIMIWQWRW